MTRALVAVVLLSLAAPHLSAQVDPDTLVEIGHGWRRFVKVVDRSVNVTFDPASNRVTLSGRLEFTGNWEDFSTGTDRPAVPFRFKVRSSVLARGADGKDYRVEAKWDDLVEGTGGGFVVERVPREPGRIRWADGSFQPELPFPSDARNPWRPISRGEFQNGFSPALKNAFDGAVPAKVRFNVTAGVFSSRPDNPTRPSDERPPQNDPPWYVRQWWLILPVALLLALGIAMWKRAGSRTRAQAATAADDVFVSYNTADHSSIRVLTSALESAGLRLWFDDRDLSRDGPFPPKLAKAIWSARCFLLILGGKGLGRWQRDEVNEAIEVYLKRGRRGVTVLLLPSAKKEDLPEVLRSIPYIDVGEVPIDSLTTLRQIALGVFGLSADQAPGGPIDRGWVERARQQSGDVDSTRR